MGFWAQTLLTLLISTALGATEIGTPAQIGPLQSYELKVYRILSPISLEETQIYHETFMADGTSNKSGNNKVLEELELPGFPANMHAHVLKHHTECQRRDYEEKVVFSDPKDGSFQKVIFEHDGPRGIFRIRDNLLLIDEYVVQEGQSLALRKRFTHHHFQQNGRTYRILWESIYSTDSHWRTQRD